MTVKQVIVMRKDLKMRRGKEIAQGAHASMKWLVERVRSHDAENRAPNGGWDCNHGGVQFRAPEQEWIDGLFTKICLQVDSPEELTRIYHTALHNGLMVYMITDSGATEFNGVPTQTCLAIGPEYSERIDPITQHLKLY